MPNSALRAWRIIGPDDFKGKLRDRYLGSFEISATPNLLRRRFKEAGESSPAIWERKLTPADKILQGFAFQLNVDPMAGEDFFTVRRTPPVDGFSCSLHGLGLDGGEKAQDFHIHPPGRLPGSDEEVIDSSIRHVLLYPLYNRDTGEDGCTFEWIEPEGDITVSKTSSSPFPYAEAQLDGPLYQLPLKRGEVTLVRFPLGPHRFKGPAFAFSTHFIDVDHGPAFDPYLGNTACFGGTTLQEREERAAEIYELDRERIIPNTSAINGKTAGFASLRHMVYGHGSFLRDTIERHGKDKPGSKPTSRSEGHLAKGLRNFSYG